MNYLIPIIALSAGLALGGLAVWISIRAKVASAVAETTAELQPHIATLTERVAERGSLISRLEDQLRGRDGQIVSLQTELTGLKVRGSELQTTLDKERKAM